MNSIYVSRGLENNMLSSKTNMFNMARDRLLSMEPDSIQVSTSLDELGLEFHKTEMSNNTKTKALELLPTTIEVSNDESTDNNTKMRSMLKESLMSLLNTDADVMRLIRDTIMEVMEQNDMLETYNMNMFTQARNRLLSTDAECIRVPSMFNPDNSRADASLDDVSEFKIPELSPE